MKRTLLAVASVALMAGTLQTASAADPATVSTPTSPQGWYFTSDHTGEDGVVIPTTGSGGWVEDGAGGSPGPGSFLLEVDNNPLAEKARLETQQFNGSTLGELVSVAYSTHKTGTPGYAPSINVAIDPEGPDDFVTLVWEANKAGFTVTDGVWQSWDTAAGDGWWSPSITTVGTPGRNNLPTDLATLAAYFGESSEVLNLAVNVGRHGPMSAHTDGVAVTTADGTSSFDFELFSSPSTKDDCKDGGWQTFNAPTFKNQGQCVSHVQTA